MFHFYTPWKHMISGSFLLFSRGVRRGTVVENGLNSTWLNCIEELLWRLNEVYLCYHWSDIIYTMTCANVAFQDHFSFFKFFCCELGFGNDMENNIEIISNINKEKVIKYSKF